MRCLTHDFNRCSIDTRAVCNRVTSVLAKRIAGKCSFELYCFLQFYDREIFVNRKVIFTCYGLSLRLTLLSPLVLQALLEGRKASREKLAQEARKEAVITPKVVPACTQSVSG